MVVSCSDNSTSFSCLLVYIPSSSIPLFTYLHEMHILMPTADAPNGFILSKLFSDLFFQAEDGIRDDLVTGVQTCALPILWRWGRTSDGTLTSPEHPHRH